jgi:hypothetical protein
MGRGRLELLDGLQVGHEHRVEDVGAPLLMGRDERLVVAGRPRHFDLHAHRLALPAAGAERLDDPAQALRRRVHGDQAVGPAAAPCCGLLAERGADQRGRPVRQGPQPGAVDAHPALRADLVPLEQAPDDLDALEQPGIAFGLGRPPFARDVLVRGLTRSQRHPQPARVHLCQRRDGLGDDDGVVALPRGVDHSERDRNGLHGGAEPRPGEPRLALRTAPGRHVVRGRHGPEAGLGRCPGRLQEGAGRKLLVGCVIADDGHL